MSNNPHNQNQDNQQSSQNQPEQPGQPINQPLTQQQLLQQNQYYEQMQYYNQFQMNPNQVPNQYPQQWQYFNQNLFPHQFLDYNQHQQSQLQQLQAMGFDRPGRNRALLKKFNGDLNLVIEKLLKQRRKHQETIQKVTSNLDAEDEGVAEINKLENTRVLIVDCNNVFYANRELMKECNYRINQKKCLKMFLRQLVLLTLNYEHKIESIKLIWDRAKYDKLQYKDLPKQILKLQEESSQLPEKRKHVMKRMISLKQQIHAEVLKIPKQDNLEGITIYLEQEKQDKIKIQSAKPFFQNADDMIVYEVANLPDFYKIQTTVVTSDKGLKKRLEDQGIQLFIGNGAWQRLDKTQQPQNLKVGDEQKE